MAYCCEDINGNECNQLVTYGEVRSVLSGMKKSNGSAVTEYLSSTYQNNALALRSTLSGVLAVETGDVSTHSDGLILSGSGDYVRKGDITTYKVEFVSIQVNNPGTTDDCGGITPEPPTPPPLTCTTETVEIYGDVPTVPCDVTGSTSFTVSYTSQTKNSDCSVTESNGTKTVTIDNLERNTGSKKEVYRDGNLVIYQDGGCDPGDCSCTKFFEVRANMVPGDPGPWEPSSATCGVMSYTADPCVQIDGVEYVGPSDDSDVSLSLSNFVAKQNGERDGRVYGIFCCDFGDMCFAPKPSYVGTYAVKWSANGVPCEPKTVVLSRRGGEGKDCCKNVDCENIANLELVPADGINGLAGSEVVLATITSANYSLNCLSLNASIIEGDTAAFNGGLKTRVNSLTLEIYGVLAKDVSSGEWKVKVTYYNANDMLTPCAEKDFTIGGGGCLKPTGGCLGYEFYDVWYDNVTFEKEAFDANPQYHSGLSSGLATLWYNVDCAEVRVETDCDWLSVGMNTGNLYMGDTSPEYLKGKCGSWIFCHPNSVCTAEEEMRSCNVKVFISEKGKPGTEKEITPSQGIVVKQWCSGVNPCATATCEDALEIEAKSSSSSRFEMTGGTFVIATYTGDCAAITAVTSSYDKGRVADLEYDNGEIRGTLPDRTCEWSDSESITYQITVKYLVNGTTTTCTKTFDVHQNARIYNCNTIANSLRNFDEYHESTGRYFPKEGGHVKVAEYSFPEAAMNCAKILGIRVVAHYTYNGDIEYGYDSGIATWDANSIYLDVPENKINERAQWSYVVEFGLNDTFPCFQSGYIIQEAGGGDCNITIKTDPTTLTCEGGTVKFTIENK